MSSPRGSFFLCHAPRAFPSHLDDPSPEAWLFLGASSQLEATDGHHLLLCASFSSCQFCPQMGWGCFHCGRVPRAGSKGCDVLLLPRGTGNSLGPVPKLLSPKSSPSTPEFTVYTQAGFQCSPCQPSHSPSASDSSSVKWQ